MDTFDYCTYFVANFYDMYKTRIYISSTIKRMHINKALVQIR